MTKEKSALEEIARLQAQIEAKRQEGLEELRARLKAARTSVREIEEQIQALSGKTLRRGGAGAKRAQKTCSVCRKQGKSGEGHTAPSHAEWLKAHRE
jgi:DNA-binding protein H-NS